MKCPFEKGITVMSAECNPCYITLRHVPCPLDIYNPFFLRECRNTTSIELLKEHPDWAKELNLNTLLNIMG